MLGQNNEIYLARFVVDMRKSIDGLSVLVSDHFGRNPTDGSMYVFLNRTLDKLKLLYWDRNGFVVSYRRLEKGRFKLSLSREGVYQLDAHQLQWLLSGLPFDKIKGHPKLQYQLFS